MERIDALKELLAKVKAGGHVEVKELIANDAANFPLLWLGVGRIMDGSLDAAKALHDAVLPGWMWYVTSSGVAVIYDPEFVLDINGGKHAPARAWLCAIIKALIKQEES